MSRFDATTRTDRRELIAAGIRAQRERESGFCTFEAAVDDVPTVNELGVPWVQCTDQSTAADCTPEELERAKELLDAYPQYRIEEITRPDETEGVYIILHTPGDLERRAQLVDDFFVTVFELNADYRLWAASV